ncbi:MAG: DUF1761 family protein [Gemmatimonadaceae bacterium]
MRLLLAIIAATVGISLTDWLFFGVIFHDDYMKTPGMWRTTSENRKIAVSMLVSVIGTAAFLLLAQRSGIHGFGPMLSLSILVWLAAALPLVVTSTLYLNYSARLGVSHSLGYLARLVVAAVAYAIIVP